MPLLRSGRPTHLCPWPYLDLGEHDGAVWRCDECGRRWTLRVEQRGSMAWRGKWRRRWLPVWRTSWRALTLCIGAGSIMDLSGQGTARAMRELAERRRQGRREPPAVDEALRTSSDAMWAPWLRGH